MKKSSSIPLMIVIIWVISSIGNLQAITPDQYQPWQFGHTDQHRFNTAPPPPYMEHAPVNPKVDKESTAPKIVPPLIQVSPETRDELNINFSNKHEVERQFIQTFYKRGEHDADLLLKTIDNLHNSVRELHFTASELQRASDESAVKPVSVKDYLDKVRAFNLEVNIFLNKINGLEYLPTLRDDIMFAPDKEVDKQHLIAYYQSTLASLQSQVSTLHFTLALPNGGFYPYVGIETDQLKKMPLYNEKQITEMKRKIISLRAMSSQDKQAIDEGINRFTKNAVETFIDTFGTSERYRTSSDPMGKEMAMVNLYETFWARAFIRSTYGTQIGCIPVEYDKRIFNLDYYLSDMTIGAAPIYDQNKLTHYANLAKEAMATIHGSASDSSTGQKWSSINGWLNWLSGKTNEMDTKLIVIGLIQEDLNDELSLSRSGGLRAVRDRYRQRYLGSEMQRALYQSKAKQVFKSPNDLDEDDIESDVEVIEPGTLRGAIATCINALENQEFRLGEARQLQSVVDLLAKDNVFAERRKKRYTFERPALTSDSMSKVP